MNLTRAQEERVKEFVRDVVQADKDLEARREKVSGYIKRFEAQQGPVKNFPFVGCSNVPIPMLAIARDAVGARLLNDVLGGQDQVLNCEPIHDEPLGEGITDPETGKPISWRDVSEAWQEYFNFEVSPAGEVPFKNFVADLIDEKTIVGTVFPICEWLKRNAYTMTTDGKISPFVDFDNVHFRVPSFENLVFPHGYSSLARMPFMGEKYVLRPSEALLRVDAAGWDKTAVREFLDKKGNPAALLARDLTYDENDKLDDAIMYRAKELLVGETWARVPFDNSGREVPLLIDHSYETDPTIFRVVPWPYAHRQMKFLPPDQYIRRKDRLFGMGMIERGQWLDEALSVVANQIIDAGTLHNTTMFSVDENVVGMQEISRAAPMRVVPRGDNPQAIVPMPIGMSNPTLFEGFNILLMLFEKVIKVSDYDLGRESQQLGKDGTATGILALLKQSGQYYDTHTRGTRATANHAAWMWMQLLAQQQPVERVARVMGMAKAQTMLGVLQLGPEDLSKRLGLYVAYSNDAATQELKRQQDMAKFQILQTYYQGVLGLAQSWLTQIVMRPLITEIGRDAHLRMRAMLESYGESYSNRNLPGLETMIDALNADPQMAAMANMQAMGGMLDEQGASAGGDAGQSGVGGSEGAGGEGQGGPAA